MSPAFVAYPRGPRYAAIGFSLVLVVGAIAAFVALGADLRSRFTVIQVITLLVFLTVMVTFMFALGFSSIRVEPERLWFRNGLRTHVLPWSDLGEIRFAAGSPWPHVVLRGVSAEGDHDTVMLMGIQGSDHAYAQAQYEALLVAVDVARRADAGSTDD